MPYANNQDTDQHVLLLSLITTYSPHPLFYQTSVAEQFGLSSIPARDMCSRDIAHLTHFSRMDFPTLINWTIPFSY